MEAPTTFAEAQDVLAAQLPGYTRRQHQMDLAAQIELAIADSRHGLFQAGTGTGKSFAILIPLILSGQRAIVATSTKALQSQYAKGDLPFLAEHLGVDFDFAILKGRSNYPCWAKAEGLTWPSTMQKEVLGRMKEMGDRQSIIEGKIIDREDFPALSEDEWMPFSMSASECPGAKHCPFAEKCFAERAKNKAAEAQVVITNTAYLMQDLILRRQTEGNVALLGDYALLAVDEAHNLPEAATSALEDTIGEGTFIRLGRDMAGYLVAEGGNESVAEKIEQAVEVLWNQLQMRHSDFILRAPSKTDPMPLTVPTIIGELGDGFRGLYQAIEAARDEIKATPAMDERGKTLRYRLMRRSADWLARIMAFATDDPAETIRWAEAETKKIRGEMRTRLYLRSAPVSVAPFLRSAMWDAVPTILSSATLAAGNDFGYLSETVGLGKDEALTYDAGSPFDYPRQVRLFVPGKDMPEPDRKTMTTWRAYAQATTRELVLRSGGGALLLFTSTTAMREAHDALAHQFRAHGLSVLRQGERPTSELIRAFKADGNAVLFGLKTFMEGIDVPTKALRLVVLDKLPFAVPSDLLYQARCEAINRRYNDRWSSFTRLTIPSMILVLTQAFGRLIRHRDDMGVVAILDSRLSTKRYGPTILKALPPARRTSSIEEVAAFLESAR